MIITISNAQAETAAAIASKATTIGRQIFAIVTSEKAQNIYKSVITAIVLLVVVIAIGLSKAAQYCWAEFIKPGSIVVATYAKEKASKAISQAQLSEWIWMAKAQTVGAVVASIVGMSAVLRGA